MATNIEIIHDDIMFKGLTKHLEVGRYHSWIVEKNSLPDCLEVTAVDQSGTIMAIRHKSFNVRGVQFHPESILTPDGKTLLRNFFEYAYLYQAKLEESRANQNLA